jgi:DnaK suppressor protein
MERTSIEDGSGLTSEERQLLRARLEQLRGELRARLGREQAVVTEGEPLPEPMDAAEQTREQDDAVVFTQRDRALLAEVERALGKLESGGYGVSEASGRPIGFRRLQAVPWARLAADEAERG